MPNERDQTDSFISRFDKIQVQTSFRPCSVNYSTIVRMLKDASILKTLKNYTRLQISNSRQKNENPNPLVEILDISCIYLLELKVTKFVVRFP